MGKRAGVRTYFTSGLLSGLSARIRSFIVFFLLLLVLQIPPALADTEGPNNPGTAASVERDTDKVDWGNVSSGLTSNNSNASASYDFGGLEGVPTDYLQLTNYGFSIPADATINGITVSIERSDNSDELELFHALDSEVKLVKGGSVVGDNKADTGTEWTNEDTMIEYGGASDLWGETWTVDDINATDFGVVLATTFNGFEEAMKSQVDVITITVTYTPSATISSTLPMLGVGS